MRYDIHAYAQQKSDKSLADWKAYREKEDAAKGAVNIPRDSVEVGETEDGLEIWWAPKLNRCWVAVDGSPRGGVKCVVRDLTEEEVAKINAEFAEQGDEPINA